MIRDQVPVGSNRQQVNDFIKNLKFGSLRIGRGDFNEANQWTLGSFDPEKEAELEGRIREFIGAVVFDAESGLLYHDNLLIRFYLDENGKVIGYTVKMDGTV